MTITRVIGKGRTQPLKGAAFEEIRAKFATSCIDVGTGDGRFAYHLASADPNSLVIGIDALAANMGERAATAARKPAKGGRPNLLLVHAAIEVVPIELEHVADHVYVQLPWGALLEGIVTARPDVLGGIAALCRRGARVEVTLNGEIWVESTPTRYASLPVPTPEYVRDVVAPGFAAAGIQLRAAAYLNADDAQALPTTWARKLGHDRPHPRFVHFVGDAS